MSRFKKALISATVIGIALGAAALNARLGGSSPLLLNLSADEPKTSENLFSPTPLTRTSPTRQLMGPADEVGGTPSDRLDHMGALILDKEQSPDKRSEALAELTQAGAEAIPVLTRIASAPLEVPAGPADPHSTTELSLKFEKSLRVTALESIDQWSTRDVDVRPSLRAILSVQTDPDLSFMGSVSLSGIEQGRPGKLTRFIDQMLEQGTR